MRGNRVTLVDYSFMRSHAPFQSDTYGSEWETCPTTSSTAVTDRKGLGAGSNPEAQDSATLAPLKKTNVLPDAQAGVPRCFSRE